MRKIIYAAIAAMMILSGCEYNPLYDGQEFQIYHKSVGLVDTDGVTIYVPIVTEIPFALKLYGGKGENHLVKAVDEEYLDYSYNKCDVVREGIDDPEFVPAEVVLKPKKLGHTAITVEDVDTGESITVDLEICESYKAMEVNYSQNSLDKGTIIAFPYAGKDDVVKFLRGSVHTGEIDYVTDGRYAFVLENDMLCLELTFPADEYGQPADGGVEVYRKYSVSSIYGGYLTSPDTIFHHMNMTDMPYETKAGFDMPEYFFDFQCVDITDGIVPDDMYEEAVLFYMYSAITIPWYF